MRRSSAGRSPGRRPGAAACLSTPAAARHAPSCSPSVSVPFGFGPGSSWNWLYCGTSTSLRFLNSTVACGVRLSRTLPCASCWRPVLSKPCVSSWPATAPRVQQFTTGSGPGVKNGGCAMAVVMSMPLSGGSSAAFELQRDPLHQQQRAPAVLHVGHRRQVGQRRTARAGLLPQRQPGEFGRPARRRSPGSRQQHTPEHQFFREPHEHRSARHPAIESDMAAVAIETCIVKISPPRTLQGADTAQR